MESKVVVEVLGCGKRIMLARWQKQRRGIDAGTYREIPLRVRSWLTENSGSCKLRRNLRPESTHRRINMKPEPTDQPVVADLCGWTQNFDGAWDTGCGNVFEITEGSPLENSMKFCCYCGKPIGEGIYEDDDDE